MSSFGGRWSAAPPRGGSPSGFSERAVSQRTSIPWALPPWSDETPPFTRTSATPSLATTMRSLPRASPCLRVFCGVPYGRPEKTTLLWATTFLPNSATRTDTRARPYGLLCSSPARDSLPRLRSWSLAFTRRHAESRVVLRDCLDEPSRAHLPCAMLDGVALERVGSLTQETVAEPQAISGENLRLYLRSDEDTHRISTAAARAEGSE